MFSDLVWVEGLLSALVISWSNNLRLFITIVILIGTIITQWLFGNVICLSGLFVPRSLRRSHWLILIWYLLLLDLLQLLRSLLLRIWHPPLHLRHLHLLRLLELHLGHHLLLIHSHWVVEILLLLLLHLLLGEHVVSIVHLVIWVWLLHEHLRDHLIGVADKHWILRLRMTTSLSQ